MLAFCNKQYDTKVPNVNAVVFSSNWWSDVWWDQISLKMKIICVALFFADAVKHIFEHIFKTVNSLKRMETSNSSLFASCVYWTFTLV